MRQSTAANPHSARQRPPPTHQPLHPPKTAARSAAEMKRFVDLISLDVDMETARSLSLKGKSLASVPVGLGALLKCVRKLDLSENNLRDLSPLSSLPQLSNLNVSKNANLRSLQSLASPNLVVLCAASCGLTSLKGLEVCASTLCTLIVNDNALQLQAPVEQRKAAELSPAVRSQQTDRAAVDNFDALSCLSVCETVVLTRNEMLCALYPKEAEEHKGSSENAQTEDSERDGPGTSERQEVVRVRAAAHPLSVFEKLPRLKKLSLSECNLTSLPARWFLPLVGELRLARNQLASLQPEGVIVRSLKMLDVSHNALTAVSTLRRCCYLQKLSVHGNPLVELYVQRDREEKEPAERGNRDEAPASGPASAAAPVSLQRSLKRLLTHLESVDGVALLSEKDLAPKRRRQKTEKEGRGDEQQADAARAAPAARRASRGDREDSLAEDEPALTTTPAKDRAAARPRDPQRAAAVRAEAEERDVVVEAPESVLREARAPVVRRERVHSAPQKNVALSGGAAVAQLLKRRQEQQGW